MTETPNPSTAELLAIEPLVNGNIGAAQDELVRRLRALLPDLITAFNSGNGWTSVTGITPVKPQDVGLAPTVLSDAHIGAILVKVSVETAPEGIGGTFRNSAKVEVFSIDGRLQSAQQVRVEWRRSEAIRLCLFPFLSGCVNASGQRVWRSLQPQGYSLLSGDWAKAYSGTVTTFSLVQSPSESY